MSELFVSSENQRAGYPKYFRMLEKKLKKLQFAADVGILKRA